jgi:hypothetical protein
MKAITIITFLFVTLLSLSLASSCQLMNFYSIPTPLPTFTPDIKDIPTVQVINSETPTLTFTSPAIAGDLGWGTIHGKVTDAVSGIPIVNAKVTCNHFSYTSTARCQGDTFTDIDGNYIFINIFFHDTDTIQLRVEALGYELKEFEQSFFTFPELISDFALSPKAAITTCIQPSCGPYEALICSQGDCSNGCGFVCVTPVAICTPPLCAIGTSEVYYCSGGGCAGGCGTTCATYTPKP